MLIDEDVYLAHYGVIRKSGRYPWGSGGNTEQNHRSFVDYLTQLRESGMSESEMAKALDITTTELRAQRMIATNAIKQSNIDMAQRLKDKGMSNSAIANRMGLASESSVRALLAPGVKDRADVLQTTVDMLKRQVDEKQNIDVGVGVEHHISITRNKLDVAIAMMKADGYELLYVPIEQATGKGKTLTKVLAAPGTKFVSPADIKTVSEWSPDGGRSMVEIMPPLSISSKRVKINYGEDGGGQADGLIYVRPGVDDVSLGGKRYAQVRIAVDNSHYLKGVAVYKDDLPDGVDLVFNTPKSKKDVSSDHDAMKPLNKDPDDPFGSSISRQLIDTTGSKPKVTSVMNIVNEEGRWDEWSKNLPAQFLSKQDPALANTQLTRLRDKKRAELDDILALTNPTVKKTLLDAYADGVDSAAVHLKAAPMPGQATKVILPVNAMKDTEIYAPSLRDGDRVALVRFPHGGTFEIPELTVNNKVKAAKDLLGQAPDAVGINSKVAERLSGADFDGDTVLVIPNNSGRVKSTPSLEGLKNFDPKSSYKAYEGMPRMTKEQKQMEMGKVSNLVTDMTIKGASPDEIARAVRHSMVVIDAEKHNLNYKQSAIDNGIVQLKAKYQGGANKGASTLISRASSEQRVNARRKRRVGEGGFIDKQTGEQHWVDTNETFVTRSVNKKTGVIKEKVNPRTIKSTQGAEAKDAHALSSGTKIERIYADHSNELKAYAKEARKVSVNTKPIPYSPSAKTAYAKEVASLDASLNLALRNAPLERQAQILAKTTYQAKKQANPNMDRDDESKLLAKEITRARARVGADKMRVTISPSEWDAIQAGAISPNKLTQILRNTDLDVVKTYATPRQATVMTSAKQTQAKNLLNSGRTLAEVADILGVNVNTLKSSLSEGSE